MLPRAKLNICKPCLFSSKSQTMIGAFIQCRDCFASQIATHRSSLLLAYIYVDIDSTMDFHYGRKGF